jgi:formylglycine-generating enzyme required for sulfatase activity
MNRILSIFMLLLFTAAAPGFSENKTALIIANGNYSHFSRLTNPVPEARNLSDALVRLGFQVTLLTDASKEEMLESLYNFERIMQGRGGTALFHYGGHAVQVNGKNYLIPVDADIPDELRVRTRALDLEEVMLSLDNSGSETNIVILDSCRNNPLPGISRNGARGLNVIRIKPKNSIIVYSAEAGTTAADGVFTPSLLEHIETPGLSFSDVIKRTRRMVFNKTNGNQIPGAYEQLFDSIYLAGTDPAHKKQFVLVKAGTFTMGSPQDEFTRDENENQHSVTITGDFYISRYEVTQGEYRSVMGDNPSKQYIGIGDTYPVNNISWYDALVYCNKLSEQDGFTPAYTINDSEIIWHRNADGYRLPTEAEWEYAARGGHNAGEYNVYAGSDDFNIVGWHRENSGKKTHPVGLKKPNELGLYDMTGNVWEWCWDWFGTYPSESVTDPAGPPSGSFHVVRGGGCMNDPLTCRTANRPWDNPTVYSPQGIRLVRTRP